MHRPLVRRMGIFRSARLWSLRTKVQFGGSIGPLCWWGRRRRSRCGCAPGDGRTPGDGQIDLPCGTRLRVDAFVNERSAAACPVRVAEPVVIPMVPGTKRYMAFDPVRCAWGFDRLAARVAQVLDGDPFSGHLFLFRGKRADYLKVLYYSGTGLCLFAKRLESGKFVWPPIVDGKMVLTPAQLTLLIEAMDWRRTVAADVPRRPMAVG